MADNRIAYGLAKKHGIDTEGMTPKEVWDALNDKGIDWKKEYLSDREEEEHKREAYARKWTADVVPKTEEIRPSEPNRFQSTLKSAKESVAESERWRVDVHEISDYKGDKLFVSRGGSCVAVEPDGNIISVCKKDGDSVRGSDLLKHAIKNGGDRLDAFSDLYYFYVKQGFEPVSWVSFNEEYAPEGWDKNRDEKEPIIFFKYTGKRTTLTREDFLKNNKPFIEYDEAKSFRDKEVKK